MKIGKFCIAAVISLFIFNTCYANDAVPHEVDKKVSHISSLRSFSADYDTLDNIIPKAVYVDKDGNVKSIFIKAGKNEPPIGLTIKIGGVSRAVNEEKDANNNIFHAVNGINISGETVKAELTCDGGETIAYTSVKVIEIKEASDEEWTISSDNRLLQYTGSEKDIVVPNFYNGRPIISLGGDTVRSGGSEYYVSIVNDREDALKSVEISEGIVNIYPFAFYESKLLESINLPDTTEKIYIAAFFECSGISGELKLPPNLNYLDEYTFYGCSSLTGGLDIPGGVKNIGEAAFFGCSGFNGALVLNDGIESIGTLAFGGSYEDQMRFTSVKLPDTLKSIGCYAFQWCSYIKGEFVLPEGLETISDGAFDHLESIENKTFVIPSTVKTIGGDNEVSENTGYGGHIFYDMGGSDFTAFEVADGSSYFCAVDGVLYSSDMKRMLAYPCGKDGEKFILPDSVVQIDEMAFSRNKKLKTLVLPDNYKITDVPENILNKNANSLAAGLYIYTSVKNVEVSGTNPYYRSQNGILYSKDMKTLWYVPPMYEGNVKIDETCEKIEQGAIFTGAAEIGWTEFIIPDSVTDINSNCLDYLNRNIKNVKSFSVSVSGNKKYTLNKEGEIVEYKNGDADLSGEVNKKDAALILKYLTGTYKDININAADADNSREITILDAVEVMKGVG